MNKTTLFSTVFIALATFAAPAQDIRIDSFAAIVDPNGGTPLVNFTLDFNRAPDFFTLDGFGRQHDGFQFYINNASGLISLIRGSEIHVAGNVRVRNLAPSDPDPNSGGWGTVRGAVPYVVNSDVMTFTVPLATLNAPDPFSYGLQILSYGSETQSVSGVSGQPGVPEPTSATLLAAGFSLVLGVCRPRSMRATV